MTATGTARRPQPRRLATPHELLTLVGHLIGTTAPRRVDQDQVDRFAEATGDRQWIHVDTERARSGPFGTTVVHGYLTLSLLPVLLDEVLIVEGTSMTLNYGLDRVRFPAALPVGSVVSAGVTVRAAEDRGDAVRAVLRVTVTAEGAEKPCCVADSVLQYVT